jgi:HU domain fused to wHTH, Ig, or Glycine-rich motif/Domain of unknown function (DUF4469) with IG-like fold
MLQVAFVDSRMREDLPLVPRIVQRENITYEEVLAYMSKGAVVSDSDTRAVLTQFSEAVFHFLAKGSRVQTPLGALSIHLHRNSVDVNQRTVSTDSVVMRIKPASAAADELKRNLQVSVVDTPPAQVPLVYSVTNVDNAESVDGGKPGEILHLTGSRLSFDKRDVKQGVVFIDGSGKETRAAVYSRVGSNFIDCKIPNVAAGNYSMEVRTCPAKHLKSGAYKSPIIVAAASLSTGVPA